MSWRDKRSAGNRPFTIGSHPASVSDRDTNAPMVMVNGRPVRNNYGKRVEPYRIPLLPDYDTADPDAVRVLLLHEKAEVVAAQGRAPLYHRGSPEYLNVMAEIGARNARVAKLKADLATLEITAKKVMRSAEEEWDPEDGISLLAACRVTILDLSDEKPDEDTQALLDDIKNYVRKNSAR